MKHRAPHPRFGSLGCACTDPHLAPSPAGRRICYHVFVAVIGRRTGNQVTSEGMSGRHESEQEGGLVAAEETKPKLEKPKRYKVILHNDDYTTMEFVVYVLRTVFHYNESQATTLMLEVHQKGHAIVGSYSYEVAETKVAKVMRLAREAQFPLLCSMEPE